MDFSRQNYTGCSIVRNTEHHTRLYAVPHDTTLLCYSDTGVATKMAGKSWPNNPYTRSSNSARQRSLRRQTDRTALAITLTLFDAH